MPKRVGEKKDGTEPSISINLNPPAEVYEIVTVTEPQKEPQSEAKPTITAQEILEKSPQELEKLGVGKREANNLAQTFRIITAILLGKNKNKELAQALDTDKSFVAKQVKELEQQGLVKKEEEGREVRYVADQFNIMKFLQTKVIIKVKEKPVGFSNFVREGAQDKKKQGFSNLGYVSAQDKDSKSQQLPSNAGKEGKDGTTKPT